MDDISGFDITIDDVECFSALKHKTVLITGGTGLICSWLVRYLMFLNDRYSFDIDIFLLVRSLNKAESMFGIDSHIHYYKQDITEPINYCFDNIDYWVLGACNAYPGAFKEMPVDILDQNYLGVHNACSYIIEKGICPQKIIYISSSEVYGEYDFVDGVTEDFLGNVNQASLRACYSEGKRATETLCFAYSYQYGINISIARPGYIFGFIPYTKSNRADIEFFTNANNHEPIILTSLGSQIRSYCYVEDTVRALLYILLVVLL